MFISELNTIIQKLQSLMRPAPVVRDERGFKNEIRTVVQILTELHFSIHFDSCTV